ncbi:MAG: cell division protein FtsZ [Flavobacteriia bacterium]|nr:cell division protein FtsZ [Flavobacteriia bacterium]
MEEISNSNFSFDLPKNRSNVIKVIGVGGGGSNAINHMFQQGINGVDFVVCNTDAQALQESPVPIKIQLGATLTEGLGAGANPEVGAKAAEESMETLQALLETHTKMIFITAGMGGGTGTGAAPILARMAKAMDILTVGIVTMPFQFEGKLRLDQAQDGLDKLRAEVDSLIVINNNKLREVYGNLGFKTGFAKADEVLATAARGIAEVITHHYTQNIDLKDAKTVLTNSGTAIMGSAQASGAQRAQEAIVKALDSPLLNDNKIKGCKNVLLLIVSGTEEITIDEIGEINDFIQDEAGHNANIIMGVGEDESLDAAISVTVIATGFNADQQHEIVNSEAKKIIHNLEEDQVMQHDLGDLQNTKVGSDTSSNEMDPLDKPLFPKAQPEVTHLLIDDTELEEESNPTTEEEVIAAEEDPMEAPQMFSLTDEEAYEVSLEEINTIDNHIVAEDLNDTQVSNEETSAELLSEEALYNLEVVYEIIAAEQEPQFMSPVDEFEQSLEETTNAETVSEDLEEEAIVLDFEPPAQAEAFIINDLDEAVMEMEVLDEEEIVAEPETQITFDFDLPLAATFEEANDVAPEPIDENQAEEPNPVKHDLETVFQDTEEITFSPKATTEVQQLKEEETTSEDTPAEEQTNHPFDRTIQKTVRIENEKRKAQLKKFNYVFKANLHKIEELERQPAYKRQGIDLDAFSEEQTGSRISVDRDSNDDIQLRSNNSYLHDNVD